MAGLLVLRLLSRPLSGAAPTVARYAVIGLWPAWLAPLLFVKTRLAAGPGSARDSAAAPKAPLERASAGS